MKSQHKISAAFALFGLVIALLALVGSALDLAPLMDITGQAALNPWTALCLVLISSSLLGNIFDNFNNKFFKKLNFAAPLFVIAICLLKTPSYMGWDFNIDQWLLNDAKILSQMSIATTIGLMGLALGQILSPNFNKKNAWVPQVFSLSTLSLIFFAMIGYAYNTSSLLNHHIYSGLSYNTAMALTALALSSLLLQAHQGWIKVLVSPYYGGVVARRLLPIVIILPLVISMLWMFGAFLETFSFSFAVTGSVYTKIIFLTAIVWWLAARLNRLDEARSKGEIEQKKLNHDLADMVAQLKSLNQELQDFSYSVAHDLKAPLRSMNFFSDSILKDENNQLNSRNQEDLKQVYQASLKMNQLINGLMGLYKVNRTQLTEAEVDLSHIAHSFLSNKKNESPDRNFNFSVTENLIAQGDPLLLEDLLINLLDNACKFTSKKSETNIEFGLKIENGEPAYFIKDNGAGFNMKYKDQLFQNFKRLHQEQEFPGSGIGLVTAKKIVLRHGGKIWVDSELEKGTTFYFTLRNLGS